MTQAKKEFMQAAIDDADAHLADEGGGPFGACIVKHGKVVAVAHNTVLENNDPTCHAEVNAIRAATQALKTHDLSGCEIYSTTEPCPMCFSAIHWAKIGKIIFGTRIQDAQDLGFNELEVTNEQMKNQGKSPVILEGDFMRDECLDLYQRWKNQTSGTTY